MAQVRARPLVSAQWLSTSLRGPALKILDASFHLPAAKRNAIEEFQQSRIPTAQFFDIDGVADHTTDLPHMLPTPEIFEEAMSSLGVNNDDHVVVYDCSAFGVFSAPRLWWTLRFFGHDNVSVLNGGMEVWKREGLPLETGVPQTPQRSSYKVREVRPELLRSQKQMLENISSQERQVVDARPLGRFLGKDPEPRAGLSRGHIPNSVSITFADLLDKENKVMLKPEEISKIFAARGINLNAPLDASCGSGVTACVLAFGAYLSSSEAGEPHSHPAQNVAVYDGAWAEWGSLKDSPKVVELAPGQKTSGTYFQ